MHAGLEGVKEAKHFIAFETALMQRAMIYKPVISCYKCDIIDINTLSRLHLRLAQQQ